MTKTYDVCVQVTVLKHMQIEASSRQDAVDQACELACHDEHVIEADGGSAVPVASQ